MAVAAWVAITPWLIAHIPILLVIAVIGILIYVLMQFGVTTGEIVGGVCGAFMMMFAIVYNGFVLMYNVTATFAEFVANIFIDPVYAVKKLFWDLALYINQIFASLARQIQNMLNAIPGVAVDLTSGLDNTVDYIQDKIDALTSDKNVVKIDKMEYKNLNDSFMKGYDFGSGAMDKLAGFEMPDIPGMDGLGGMNIPTTPTMPTGGPGGLGKGGAVPVKNDKGTSAGKLDVSIDKEDIKYLKDIADRDYMVKYTQSTLAPNIQVTFGDVRETADVNQVQKVLTKMLEEQIAVVAEGAM